MPDLTIVAIPCQDDYVWKLSSEKVPHLTFMHLVNVSDDETSEIEDFLDHVVETVMCPFGLSVDYRGELGPKNADVLFFKSIYNKTLEEFRSYLMTNECIDRAYNSSPQYEKWTPHLTLGYPGSPAHEDTREYPGIRWVNFDTIALWTGDYEGYEYRLDYPYEDQMYMADLDEGLSHHGIRGMKWGVRRASRAQKKRDASSEDAAKAADAYAKVRKHGVHSLSNAELKAVVDRMNLEQQYVRIAPTPRGSSLIKAGGKFAGDVLLQVGKQQAIKLTSDQVAKLVAGAFKK